ncbi:hypoxanthine phosphoribosyltransferase [Limosilactobacillus viscerum]|uniref:hypoxanthine phosphoribosyltransferase n=1 Tax=Limosilactobacillus viscerum TaxID=2993450 RepID=UPI0024BA640F|nr:hypoxanthine phosphoribosyltransferase [Limosilactobacillus viscerum]
MNNDIEKVLYSAEDIQKTIGKLADQLSEEYKDKDPLILCVLTGAVLFTVDLIEKMDIMAQMDFIDVSTYFGGTATTGQLKLIHDMTADVKGRNVLITEDIVDSGRTLQYLVNLLKERGAKSVKTVSLLNKPEGREFDVNVEYYGYKVPNEFLVGYGLDYKGYYRNLPYVGILKPSVYSED